ncbi:hypothetical protein [Haemophilus parainfluenzae]|jgi:hypothetical protein|uniref:hypothetical protein n=1 Tax=Haemophilus parainfluenzae TaxID=729 RepID=UPI00066DD9CC|nr:hypothetical protein [Haemophilus parainfluenzae]MDU6937882.1 hypothetical protein [Haemophilus parainfluenzae]DAK91856.1 MAG TPA: hypothetical protein [Caudoviricetes sp.]DAX27656.1 MAG TPA: hypothetical protein [Caudoviricetes sp.]
MENQNHKKIVDAIKAIGADYKSLHEAISAIQTQQGSGEQATLTKINELISQAETRILNKIKGGELSEDLDTLFEIAAKIGELVSDKSVREALTGTLQEIKNNVANLQSWQTEMDNLDLVGEYNKAKAS